MIELALLRGVVKRVEFHKQQDIMKLPVESQDRVRKQKNKSCATPSDDRNIGNSQCPPVLKYELNFTVGNMRIRWSSVCV